MRGFTDRGRAVLGAGLLLACVGLLLGFADLTRVGVFCAALVLLARLVAWRRRPRLEVIRAVEPAPLVSGRPGRIRVQVRNTGPRGCDPLAAAEHVSPWLGATARLVLPPLRPGEETSGTYDVRPVRRGRHLAGPLRVVSRDPLGLTHLGTAIGTPLEVLVLPPVHDLAGGDPAGLGMGHEGEAPASVLAGTEHDVSVREYRQGDDLRRVHWGVTAHRGRLMVRHEALPRLRRAVLLLDASASSWGVQEDGDAQSRSARPDTVETTASAAVASAAGAAGASGASAGFLQAAGEPGSDRLDGGPGFEWAVETLASVAAHLSGLGFTLHLLVSGAAPTGAGAADDPARPLLVDDVLQRLALVTPGIGGSTDRAGSLPATAREVAGAGGLVVLMTGDRAPAAAHETFGVLRTGLTGLAMVIDTAAFAAAADRDWWIPQGHPAAARAGAPVPGDAASTARMTAPAAGVSSAAAPEGAGADAVRLCAYARSGGWRAACALPAMSPAHAWSELIGTPRAWAPTPEPVR